MYQKQKLLHCRHQKHEAFDAPNNTLPSVSVFIKKNSLSNELYCCKPSFPCLRDW